MNSDVEEMWSGAVVVQFQALPTDLLGVSEKKDHVKGSKYSMSAQDLKKEPFLYETRVLTACPLLSAAHRKSELRQANETRKTC
jgi:hypothetical protein